jgi:AcrR family transcriptional regulator
VRVVAGRGIRDVRVADIAIAAGVGKGTIYEYFVGKEDIYRAVLQEYLDRAEAAAAKRMFRARTPREKIAALLTGWLENAENEPDDLTMLFIDVWSEAIRQTSPDIVRIFDLKKYFHDYRKLVASFLQEGIDAGEFRQVDTMITAGSLLAMCDGIMLQYLLDRDSVDVQETVRTVLDIIWNGIDSGSGIGSE